MRPPLVETVLIQEAPIQPQPQHIQANLGAVGFCNPAPQDGKVFPVDGEAVQVEVAPVHGDLDDLMQIRQRAIATNQYPLPNQRADPFQIPTKLVDLCALRHITRIVGELATILQTVMT